MAFGVIAAAAEDAAATRGPATERARLTGLWMTYWDDPTSSSITSESSKAKWPLFDWHYNGEHLDVLEDRQMGDTPGIELARSTDKRKR